MEHNKEEWVHRRAFLFSHPRTASNLLTRMLSGQSQWRITEYHFFDAFHFGRANFNDVPEEAKLEADKKNDYDNLIEQGRRQLAESLDSAAREKKHCFIKNHAFMVMPADSTFWDAGIQRPLENSSKRSRENDPRANPTMFSDDEMLSWQPIILIRNPMAVFESWMRVMGSPYPDLNARVSMLYTTLKHQRRIFDWYRHKRSTSGKGKLPIVVDADDIIEGTEAVYQLCSLLNMRPEELLFRWEIEQRSEEPSGQNMRLQHFRDTIRNSTGVDQSKTSRNLDLASKEVKWCEIFGAEKASMLAERVRISWADYEHLKAFKLCGSTASCDEEASVAQPAS